MNDNKKYNIGTVCSFVIFVIYTLIIKFVFVLPIGPEGSKVGLAPVNKPVHNFFGIIQGLKRRSVRKIDNEIIWTVIFYFIVIGVYAVFEKLCGKVIIINYGKTLFYDDVHYIMNRGNMCLN